jgi:hypothetical protein
MPMFLTTDSIQRFHDGALSHDERSLTNGLDKLNQNSYRRTTSIQEYSDVHSGTINLKNKLGSLQIRQQEIQNDLTFSETQARAASEIEDTLRALQNSEAKIKDGNSFHQSNNKDKLLSKLGKFSEQLFNGEKLLPDLSDEIFHGANSGKVPDLKEPKLGSVKSESGNTLSSQEKPNAENDYSGLLKPGGLNAKINQFSQIRSTAENRVHELKQSIQLLSIQNANIHAAGNRITDTEAAEKSIHLIRREFLSVNTDSIRVQGNVSFDNTLMYLN